MFELNKIEDIIGYHFKDESLIQRAFTHSSFSVYSYERLEFLGDSILGAVVSDYLFTNYKDLPPGKLTLLKKNIVDKPPLVKYIKKNNLQEYALVGKGEKLHGHNETEKFCGDLYEAIVGAIYKDSGYSEAYDFIIRTLENFIKEVVENPIKFVDYKSKLNEYCQFHNLSKEFVPVEQKGEQHNPIHVVKLFIDGKEIAEASGTRIIHAEQTCSQIALKKLNLK